MPLLQYGRKFGADGEGASEQVLPMLDGDGTMTLSAKALAVRGGRRTRLQGARP